MPNFSFKRRFCFSTWSSEKIRQAFDFADDYKKFLSTAKTERRVVKFIAQEAKKLGFKEIGFRPKKLGEQIFLVNRDKSIILAIKRKKRLSEVIDAGVPLLNMHAPFEVAHKGDIYSAFEGYKAFLEGE